MLPMPGDPCLIHQENFNWPRRSRHISSTPSRAGLKKFRERVHSKCFDACGILWPRRATARGPGGADPTKPECPGFHLEQHVYMNVNTVSTSADLCPNHQSCPSNLKCIATQTAIEQ